MPKKRRPSADGALIVVCFCAGALGIHWPPLALLLALGVVAIVAIPLSSTAFYFVGAVTIAAYACNSLLPGALPIVVELAVLAVTLYVVARVPTNHRVPLVYLAPIAIWLLLALNQNVPSIAVGIAGTRKATMLFVGAALGCAWPRASRKNASQLVLFVLLGTGLLSLAIHALLPSLEGSIERGASSYTAEFAGRQRLQGIFAGPFHVALLYSFLFLWGWMQLSTGRRRLLSVLAITVGLVGIQLAQVRTAYVVIGAGVLIAIARRAKGRPSVRATRRLAIAGAIGAIILMPAISSLARHDAALQSLATLGTDERSSARPTTWKLSFEMWRDSPIYGWGPGSAADTFGDEFSSRRHVTAHSAPLKYLVEGGLIGLAVVAAACVRLFRQSKKDDPAAFAALVVLIGFGLTGSIVDALPVAALLGLVLGLSDRHHLDGSGPA